MRNQRDIWLILGKRFERVRQMKGVTREALSTQCGVSIGTIQNLETKGQCSLHHFIQLMYALRLEDDLINVLSPTPKTLEEAKKLERLNKKHGFVE